MNKVSELYLQSRIQGCQEKKILKNKPLITWIIESALDSKFLSKNVILVK